MTTVEWKLWWRLRGKGLGVKFRRQHPIGPYVADFACLDAKLVLELDGDTHVKAYDVRRDSWIKSKGWRVMRVALSEIDEDLDGTVEAIAMELAQPGTMLSYGQRFPNLMSPPTSPLRGEEPVRD